jgi:hypothetical protein
MVRRSMYQEGATAIATALELFSEGFNRGAGMSREGAT